VTTTVAVIAVQVDLFVDPLTAGTGEEFYVSWRVFQLVGDVVEYVISPRDVFGAEIVSDAHLDVLSFQRQERHEGANQIMVDHAAVLQTSCTSQYVQKMLFKFIPLLSLF